MFLKINNHFYAAEGFNSVHLRSECSFAVEKYFLPAWINSRLIHSLSSNPTRLDENQELGTVKPAQEPVRIPKMAEIGEGRNTRLYVKFCLYELGTSFFLGSLV